MKEESLVIVDQHATVNVLGPCTHRPSRQGSEIALKYNFSKLLFSCKIFPEKIDRKKTGQNVLLTVA
jgi:hypothetical protein